MEKHFKLKGSQAMPILAVIKKNFELYIQQIAVEEGIDPRNLNLNVEMTISGPLMPEGVVTKPENNAPPKKAVVTPGGKRIQKKGK